jgi:hypothetical protein
MGCYPARQSDQPGLPVVYITGAAAENWAVQGVPNSILLAKPFAPAQLVTAVSPTSEYRFADSLRLSKLVTSSQSGDAAENHLVLVAHHPYRGSRGGTDGLTILSRCAAMIGRTPKPPVPPFSACRLIRSAIRHQLAPRRRISQFVWLPQDPFDDLGDPCEHRKLRWPLNSGIVPRRPGGRVLLDAS